MNGLKAALHYLGFNDNLSGGDLQLAILGKGLRISFSSSANIDVTFKIFENAVRAKQGRATE